MPATFEYFPFDSGPGANSMEAQWRDMAENWLSNGIIVQGGGMDVTSGECAVTPGTGLQISIATGRAWIKGHMFKHTGDPHLLTIASNSSGSTRTDLVVIRVNFTANTIGYQVLQGTTTPTQTTTAWDLPLATVAVPNGAASISSANITDKRVSANHNTFNPTVQITNSTSRNVAAGASVTLKWDIERWDPMNQHLIGVAEDDRITVKEAGVYYVDCMLYWKQPSASNISGMMEMSVYRNRSGTVTQFARDSRYISTSNGVQGLSKLVDFLPGDFIYVIATNTSSTTVEIDAATPYSPYLSIFKAGIFNGI